VDRLYTVANIPPNAVNGLFPIFAAGDWAAFQAISMRRVSRQASNPAPSIVDGTASVGAFAIFAVRRPAQTDHPAHTICDGSHWSGAAPGICLIAG
jgi:hypothetical protein